MHVRATEIASWLRERVTAAGSRGLVVGLSGGIDSAVVARLCQMAVPDQVLAAILPCQSDSRDEADARLVADHFHIPTIRIELDAGFGRLTGDFEQAIRQLAPHHTAALVSPKTDLKARVPLGNVKPRLRMAALYFLANSLDYLVAGTGNRCELTIGYFTKYGDGGVDLLPIGRLLKSEVRAVARDLGVPQSIIDKAPTAGLSQGQSDENDLGFTYADLERYLTDGPEAVAPALALRVERLVRYTTHKRAVPPIPAAGTAEDTDTGE